MRRPLHRRTLRFRETVTIIPNPNHKLLCPRGASARDVFLLRPTKLLHLQRRPAQRTPRLPRHSMDASPRAARDGEGILSGSATP